MKIEGNEYTNFSDSNKLLSLNIFGELTRLEGKYKILNSIGLRNVGLDRKNLFLKHMNSLWKAWSYSLLRL